MALMQTLPFTLPISEANPDLTTILFDVRVNDTIKVPTMYEDVINATAFGNIASGKGIINSWIIALGDVKQRQKTTTGNPFTVVTESARQEAIIIDTYEWSKISTETLWGTESFESGGGLNSYLALVKDIPRKTLQIDLYENKVRPMFNVWANHTVLPGWSSTTPTTEIEKESQMRNNAMALATWIKNRTVVYCTPQNTLTDVQDVYTSLTVDDLVLYIDSTLQSYIKVALSNVFNQENLKEMLGVTKIVMIPNTTGVMPLDEPIMWLCHKQKIAHITGYRTGGAIFNPEDEYTHNYLHRALGVGKFATHAGESISLKPLKKSLKQPAKITPAQVKERANVKTPNSATDAELKAAGVI